MIYDILMKLETRIEDWKAETLRHVKLINDIERKRSEDSLRLDEAFKRIQELEEKIKALEDTVEYLEGKL